MFATPHLHAPDALRLSRVQFDAILRQALRLQRRQPASTLFAYAPTVLQQGPAGMTALAGNLSTGPMRDLHAKRPGDNVTQQKQGLLLFALLSPAAVLPQGDEAWESWLTHSVPSHDLTNAAANTPLMVLWLRLDGLGALMARCTMTHTNLGLAKTPPWLRVPQLQLPGGGNARVVFAATPNAPRPASRLPVTGALPDPDRRDNLQAGAFGIAQLLHLQQSHIVLVGAGRIGSVLAHGLVRLGVKRLTVIEPDEMELHNLDGDMSPLYEGQPKVEALRHFLRGVQRPGAVVDLHHVSVQSPVVGGLVAQADAVVACVDNDAARLWANAWALAHNRCILAVAVGVHDHGAETDLRLIAAGSGCLACVGGYVQASDLLRQLESGNPATISPDFRLHRLGSLRSWSALAAHMGQRMLEEHFIRAGGGALFRQVTETPNGVVQVRDWRVTHEGRYRDCPFCHSLQGAGQTAVTPELLRALTGRWLIGTGSGFGMHSTI